MSLFGTILYGSGVFYTGAGTDKPSTFNFYRITDSDNQYVFYWTFNQSYLGPIVPTLDYQVQIDPDINFTAPLSFETTTEGISVILQGYSQSAAYAATNMSAGATLTLNIDGDGPQTIVLSTNITGASIAADIQAKVSILTAANPLYQLSYNNFTCTFNSLINQYTLISGGTGSGSTVVVVGGTAAPAPFLFLGLANGGLEVRGNSAVLSELPQRILIVEDSLGLFADVTATASAPGPRQFMANLSNGSLTFNSADLPSAISVVYVTTTSGDVIHFQRGNVAKAFTIPVYNRIDSERFSFYARVRLRSGLTYGPWSDTILVQTISNEKKATADRLLGRLPDRHVYPVDEAYRPIADRKTNIAKIFETYGSEFDREYLEKENTIRDLRQERTRDERLYDLIGNRFQYPKPGAMEFIDYRFLVAGAKEAALLGGTFQAVKYIGRAFTGVDPTIIPISQSINFITASASVSTEKITGLFVPPYEITLSEPAVTTPIIPGSLISGSMAAVVETPAVSALSPFIVTLSQRPANIPAVLVGIVPYTFTNNAPAPLEFAVDFLTGVVTFPSSAAGQSTTITYVPYPDVTGGTIFIDVDSDGAHTITLGGPFSSKTEIAADIQSQVRSVIAFNPALQESYDNFLAEYDASTDRFTFISGNQSPTPLTSSVVITGGTSDVPLSLSTGSSSTGLTYLLPPAVAVAGTFTCNFAGGSGDILTLDVTSAGTTYTVIYKKKSTVHTYLSPVSPPTLFSNTEAGFGIKIILNNPLSLVLDYDNVSFLLKEILPAHTKFILV